MANAQYPAGVLLDATGSPFSLAVRDQQFAPDSTGPTTVIVQPGGGRIELTERDATFRSMPYADVYSTQSPAAAVIGKMHRRTAMLRRKVYKRPPRGASQNGRPKFPQEDQDNTLYDVLCAPAPGFGGMSLREWQALSLYVNGNSLLAKFREDPSGAPTQIIPLDWRFTQAWARLGQPVIAWATVQTGELKWIAPSEVVHTAWASVSGANGAWLGTSPLQQLGVTIKIDEAAAAYAAAHFKNAARPGGVITLPVDPRQTPELTSRMQERVNEAYGGVDNAFKVAVLGQGAGWQSWGQTAEEAQLIETRKQDFLEVCAVYDMPFDALFGMNGASPESDAQVWKALMPWAGMMDDRLQSQLVDPEPEWADAGLFVRSDFDEVLYGDPLVLSDKLAAEVGIGIRTVDEARYALGLNPRGGNADLLLCEQPAPAVGPDGVPVPSEDANAGAARDVTAIDRL